MTLQELKRQDPEGMYEAVLAFPKQLTDGRHRARRVQLSQWPQRECTGVVVAGMGGSAIGGDLLKALSSDHSRLPIATVRSYTLPAWVDASTAVIASSYSGNTEETLTTMDEALARGAQVLAITTGGRMAQKAQDHRVEMALLPAGLQPRAALPYSLSALLTVCERLNLVSFTDQQWQEAAEVTQAQAERLRDPSAPDNPAIAMARTLQGRFPVVYSSEQLEPANVRWRNQIHENAKTLAVGNLLPEMNHNEIMGWARFGSELGQLAVIALRDREDHPRTQRRLEVTRSLLKPHAACWHEVHSQGRGRLARLLSLMYFSDWVSLYLAILLKVDPSPVGLISRLKAALAES
ncbi:MAG: bifunctional phosphoglucose/phosphomannose isomerase [Bacteroidota bacterium]|nr:bifunctional phosphoglucose/phosphomannose isomerase [Bacteroidota bacterium]MDE2834612.1 bifunctional phosphoglucose/phosphomannose isomerase [Bacteroidota bacterium]MDE2957723.1 bifunctional phosphoglucose/phosphomannose isomerase [Bacteroidota bacterium]